MQIYVINPSIRYENKLIWKLQLEVLEENILIYYINYILLAITNSYTIQQSSRNMQQILQFIKEIVNCYVGYKINFKFDDHC